MTKQLPNPILGTFVIEEYEGKKYKMMFAEEVKEELTDWEIVSQVNHLLKIPSEIRRNKCQTDALFLIGCAITEENKKDQTMGPFVYWWRYNSAGGHVDTTESILESGLAYHYPYQHAKSRQVIRKVVEKLGVDIFRIAAGVKKD